jgi:putative acetyltransferase
VGLSHAWLDARRELVDVWLLSPLAVQPGRQRAGIGSLLLAAAVEEASAGGAPLLFLEGDPGYYGSRGFERASPHGFAPASWRTPDAAFQVVRLEAHEDWMTGQLIYRDVWWRHDAAGLRDPLLAQLEERFG